MKNITLFKNFTTVLGRRTLAEVVDGIRSDHYKKSILKIRELVELEDQEQVDRLKKGLVAFTVSGMFIGGRKMSFLQTYNPYVILDIDKLDLADLPDLILKTKEIEFTRVAFLSPSGRGLKIIVEVDSEMEKHGLAYRQVSDLYEKELGVEIDKSGKDITRLCFMSYDPEIYYEEESTIFKVLEFDNNHTQTSSPDSDLIPRRAPDLSIEAANLTGNYDQAFGVCVMQTNAKSVFKKGNRNNYIYQLGVNCSHAGIPLEVAIVESKKEFDFNNAEIERTIKSAYNWKPYEPNEILKEVQDELPETISLEVFNKLPSLLSRGCEVLKGEKARDIFLSGALGVLSGCLPGVKGVYDGLSFYPNLFVFVIAPAGSGKGILKFAESLGQAYNDELIAAGEKDLKDYKKAMIVFDRDCGMFKKGKMEEPPTEPEEPADKTLFIPANTSAAKLINQLKENDGSGILFESEADSLGNALKQDWGGYSDLMRKGFQHETISYSRQSSKKNIIIKKPKLSIAISGTPNQVTALIPSSEDGLFSRFIFYVFESEEDWRDVSPEGGAEDFEPLYEGLSKEVLEMIHFYQKNPVVFKLRKPQWRVLNNYFRDKSKKASRDFGKEVLSVVRRMGLICFRIAMILSAIRKFEERKPGDILFCEENDFKTAMLLSKNYFEHGFFVFDRLPKFINNKFQIKNVRKQLFYDNLPQRFQRKEAIVISNKINVPQRSADRYLQALLKGNLLGKLNDSYGTYYKK